MKIILAHELDENARSKISEIFTQGFYQWLKYFSKDEGKLARAFAHIFNLDVFYVAVLDGEIAGMAACTTPATPCVRLVRSEMRKHLGFFMGSIAYRVLKKEFEEKQYPFQVPAGMGMVEFVATSSKYCGKGVATAIIQQIFEATGHSSYALEVADTNAGAMSLYKTLGFVEFMRVEQKHAKRSGVNFLVYMRTE